MSGILILVVGPSGAGKDTLIHGARVRLGGNGAFAFPRREITRPADDRHERHVPISEAEFEVRAANGAYALSWRAHGLGYGVPRAIEADLAVGRHVVVNVSRGILDEARARFGGVAIFRVSVPEPVLRQRLLARGREAAPDIEARVQRAVANELNGHALNGHEVTTILNDGPPEQAIEVFVDRLREVCGGD